jgi:N4-(beta-N-acetylglucosaminyl)-L-asparaginase
MKRRKFLGLTGLSAPAFLSFKNATAFGDGFEPIVISTWEPNKKANAVAWQVLNANGTALDAVHQGVMVPEADPDDQSVGYGGLPDRDGRVTLDACIMDHLGNCGAVMAIEYIMHPVSIARIVMEKTPHVQIVGDGALQLALEYGFKKENLLTANSEAKWKEWLKTSKYSPMSTVENIQERIKSNHDTIGMLALDSFGNVSGACSTSGMAYKLHGRVGDSPIIGAGLYVDNEVGAATSTGVGEEVVRIVGSHTVVEMMRQGKSPEDACKEAIRRIVKLRGEAIAKTLQVAFIAVNKKGEYGCYSILDSFSMAVHGKNGPKIIASKTWF